MTARFGSFFASGQALDKEKQFNGTSVVVRTDNPAKDLVYQSVGDGWEPHFVVVYGDVAAELAMLGHMLGIEVVNY